MADSPVHQSTVGSTDDQIALVLDRYLKDLQEGRACSREELLARHPEIADGLAEYLDSLQMISGLGAAQDLLPRTLGDFELLQPIGEGAMGVVYQARQLSLDRPVAVKVLRYAAGGRQAQQRFEREAELVATLDHPHIVKIHAFGKQDGLNYFAMQLIDGKSLAHPDQPTSDNRFVDMARWMVQVAGALSHAHQRDVIHRDVKPSNLILDTEGNVWLTDFGLARRFDDVRMSMTGAMLGTPNYMSPEQAAPGRRPIDHRTDIYSVGATLYELLTGQTVFPAETPHGVLARVLTEDAPAPSERCDDLPRDLETIVLKCLEKNPGDRYQTASDLADDLTAFVDGRPIKGRRPGIVERASRWRQQNQPLVRWAGVAVAATASMIVAIVAGCFAYRNANIGSLMLRSEQGPIVGQLIDQQGTAGEPFTIPFQQPMPVWQGRYRLQLWAQGRIGEAVDLFVDPGQATDYSVTLPELGVFSEQTVEGIPCRWNRPEGDGMVLLSNAGISRVDPQTGKELWAAAAKDVGAEPQQKTSQADKKKPTPQQHLVKPFQWRMNQEGSLHVRTDRSIPDLMDQSKDLSRDGESDLVVSLFKHPSVIAIDGGTGKRLWKYTSAPTVKDGQSQSQQWFSGVVHAPQWIGDVDGDGFEDLFGFFWSKTSSVRRWGDAISGQTGERLWRTEFPEKWFSGSGGLIPDTCQFNFGGRVEFRHRHTSGFQWTYWDGMAWRGKTNGLVAPWRSIHKHAGQLWMVCGTKLVCVDAVTGKMSTDWQDGQPFELGFVPAMEPRIVQGADGETIGLLLCEQVSIADPQGAATKPLCRFSMRSLATGKPIWTYAATCDPGWTGVRPDWPLLHDLDGDQNPEIVIADGADLDRQFGQRASCLCRMQALDSRTGKPLWKDPVRANIRSGNRQVQRLVVGPDEDHDGLADLYVVSPMNHRFTGSWIFVDIVSGVSGERIRSFHSKFTASDGGDLVADDLDTPFFWGRAPDGSPQLVVSSMRVDNTGGRGSTVFLSTRTGKVSHIGQGLETPMRINTEKSKTTNNLILHRPRSTNRLESSGQLVSFRAQPEPHVKLVGANRKPGSDLDGDGVGDLLPVQLGTQKIRAISGRTGQEIWSHDLSQANRGNHWLDVSVDGDQIPDVLAWTQGYWVNQRRQIRLRCLSGKNGRLLWEQSIASSSSRAKIKFVDCDLEGDGKPELLLVHDVQRSGFNSTTRITCLNGRGGTERWHHQLAATTAGVSPSGHPDKVPLRMVDVNSDGLLDVVTAMLSRNQTCEVSVISGNGQLLWNRDTNQLSGLLPFDSAIEIIPRQSDGAAAKPLVAVTTTSRQNAQGPRSVNVAWYAADTGEQISTWTAPGRLKYYWPYNDGPPQIGDGVPFVIRDRSRHLTGVCMEQSLNQTREIVVLDCSSKHATEIRRLKVSIPPNESPGGAKTGNFSVADIDGNGQSELVEHDGKHLVATTLATGIELRRRPYPSELGILSAMDLQRRQIHLQTVTGEKQRLNLIDLDSFDPVWSLRIPKKTSNPELLLSHPPLATGTTVVPHLHANRSDSSTTLLSRPRLDEYLGDDPRVIESLSEPPVTVPPVNLMGNDPRFIQPVPWSNDALMLKRMDQELDVITVMFVNCLGAIVFPLLFVRSLWRRKQWSLQTWLLTPLLFIVPYLVLQIPMLYGGATQGREIAALVGAGPWLARLIDSLFVLPIIVVAMRVGRHCWNGRWKRLLGIVILSTALGAAMGGLMVWAQIHQFPVGIRLQWWDWSHVILFVYGGWFVGGAILVAPIVKWIAQGVMAASRRARKRIRDAPSVAV